MKGNVKKLLLILLLLAFIATSVYMFISEEYGIAVFCLLFSIIIAILLHRNISLNKSPESLYKGTVSNILKTYDAILVEVENLPDISDKKLIQTISFKDMVNAEYEFRKPIYYIHNDYAYDFILFNKDDAYVYTVKIGNEKMSIVENFLAEKIREKENSSSDLDMLDSLENTTVIKLNEDKEYLVSPVRNQEQKQVSENSTNNNLDTMNNVSTINDNSSDIINSNIQSTNDIVSEPTVSEENNINVQNTNVEDSIQSTNDIVSEPTVSEVNDINVQSTSVENSIPNVDVVSNSTDISSVNNNV